MKINAAPWKHVWITGASSGLGEHTARQLAQMGCTVSISARRVERLEAIAGEEANIFAYPADVTDQAALVDAVARMEADHGPVDLAIFSSGAWFPGSVGGVRIGDFARTIDVNLVGVSNALQAVLPQMVERGSGHISWIASVSGYIGMPNSIAYSASKAALISMAESLHGQLKRKGIAVSVINPGFVRTELTDKNKHPMPYVMQPDAAASKIITGLKKQKFEIAFPWQMVLALKTLRRLPYRLSLPLLRRFI